MSKEWLTTALALLMAAREDWDGGTPISRECARCAIDSIRDALRALHDANEGE